MKEGGGGTGMRYKDARSKNVKVEKNESGRRRMMYGNAV
jgi:hypothetical protein